ncbi:hypothetical protein TNCV_3795741 [Trichonephila clavipes]|nr:hypothetical protein TNCV_3795741 [Trichonephila clavipes]
MEKIDHRYVIQYFYVKGLSSTHIKAKLDSTLRVSAPLFTTVKFWEVEFKRSRVKAAKTSIAMVDQMRKRLQK